MGREAHLMRLALGRSALDRPEDSATFTAVRAGEWTSAVHAPGAHPPSEEAIARARNHPPPQNVQLYDARGHPFNPWARLRSRKLREAQNDILSVIGVTERKIPVDRGIAHDGLDYRESGHTVDPDEDAAGDFIGNAADFDFQFISWWIHAFTNRLLVFPPTSDISFVDLVQLQWRVLGWRNFMFAGLPSFMLSHVVNPEMWTSFILYFLDRAVMASVSSRGRREAYERVRFVIAGCIEVVLNVFVLPFRLHSMLQLLGFAPASTFLSLPHPRSWIPFYSSSLIQWSWEAQPLLPFFAFRPLSSLVHQYLFMSCRPAIMEPVDAVHRRRSSGARFAYSVNSAPLIELPNEETILTTLFRRVFNFLNWGHPSYIAEKPDLPFHSGLRRRETWPVDDQASGQAEALAPDAEEPAPEAEVDIEMPLLQRIPTSATLDDNSPILHDRDDTSDATIRVSSIDPDTGAVNLEIGFPGEALLEHETPLDVHDGDGYIEPSTSTATTRRRQQQQQDLALFQKPHHVSRLAVEPTELLASLANGWIAGWLLMPLRVVVLRGLVRNVMLRPEMYGVDASRARVLPGFLGSDVNVLAPGGGGSGSVMRGARLVGLGCLVDVSLGLGFWFVEWAVVRFVGVHVFRWGTF